MDISIEFFPPKTDAGRVKLAREVDSLATLKPEFFSMTYGAGGSTRDNTRDLVLQMRAAGHDIAPHLSFGADSEETIRTLLQTYVDAGVDRLVALRGDLPSGMGSVRPVYAEELVAFVRREFGAHFDISVASYPEKHPQAESLQQDITFLKRKLDAGAQRSITQYFYNVDGFLYFRDRCEAAGIAQPIVPGIMPIANATNLLRFSDSCGADIPRWLRNALRDQTDQDSVREFGLDLVTRLCDELMQAGVSSLHFYSMNQSSLVQEICKRLGIGG